MERHTLIVSERQKIFLFHSKKYNKTENFGKIQINLLFEVNGKFELERRLTKQHNFFCAYSNTLNCPQPNQTHYLIVNKVKTFDLSLFNSEFVRKTYSVLAFLSFLVTITKSNEVFLILVFFQLKS